MAKHNKLLVVQHKDIIAHLLPVLVRKVDSEVADVRFTALKLFTDFLTQYLYEDKIYNCEENGETTQ